MRLRRKPWVDEAIHDFDAFVFPKDAPAGEAQRGHWAEVFGRKAPRKRLPALVSDQIESSIGIKSTIGLAAEVRSVSSSADTRHSDRTESRSGNMTAKGFFKRFLISRIL